MKKALVIGCTGLVGKNLIELLIQDPEYSEIKLFTRRSTGIEHPKISEFITNFDDLSDVKDKITGDALFSCLGTTIRKAGSKEVQYKIDLTYQLEFAKLAALNTVKNYVLISSVSANAGSRFFYSRIKGMLEDAVKDLNFTRIVILRPSVLKGKRDEFRFGEKFGALIIDSFAKLFRGLRKYTSISGRQVAKAMIHFNSIENKQKISMYELDELKIE